MRYISLLLLLLSIINPFVSAQDEEPFTLSIIHTNDTRAAHLPDANGNGGAARLAAVVNQIRAQNPNSVVIDAGDRFTGTLFHTQYRGQDQVQIMNLIGYNAMALGNHEFDNGDKVLADFINGLNFPVLSANLDVSGSPDLNSRVLPYTIIDMSGRQIGVIGLTTAQTTEISNPGDALIFNSNYAAIANEYAAVLEDLGVNVVILVVDVGPGEAEVLIPELVGVDVVIGGRSQTSASTLAGDYMLEFENMAGDTIYYVQAEANTRFVGRMNMTFDADGFVTGVNGELIFLSRYITPDPTVDALVADLYEQVRALSEQPIGATATAVLDGRREVCRVEECSLGSVIAESMRFTSGAQIAIMNGGGIRASIDAGDITLGEALSVQPFSNLLSTFQLSGADLITALENGVSGVSVTDGVIGRSGLSGRFPQVAGIRYSYDPTQAVGSRIVSVEIQAEDGSFSPIEPDTLYTVVTNGFIRTGGDGYTVLAERSVNPYDFGALDIEASIAYFAYLGTIEPVIDGRITIVGAELEPLP